MNSESAITKTFKLSPRLSVEMTAGQQGFTCEWIPREPDHLTRHERRVYLRARDSMLKHLAEALGIGIAVVGIEPDGSLAAPEIIKRG